MKQVLLLSFFSLLFSSVSFSQYFNQYFEGADTSYNNSVIIHLDTSTSNIWQIGPPQKTIFNSASTFPNALVTDTINNYPINNVSSFTFGINKDTYNFGGIMAIQWIQKLDLDDSLDGGYIEYSLDTGNTWINVFNDPYVYNFYGFNQQNFDTLINGDFAFSGKDTLWKDVWLCYDFSWLSLSDTLTFRFTLKSDSIDNNREGWLIDNFNVHPTWFHTINEKEQNDYIVVYPNPSSGVINVQAKKLKDFHIIEKMTVTDLSGKIVRSYEMVPTKYKIDLHDQPNGVYFINIKTNIKEEKFKVILQHE